MAFAGGRVVGALSVLTMLAACTDGRCDGAALRAALGAGSAGDAIEIGACEVEGPFVVPAGVTLRGEGLDRSTILGAVELEGGAILEDVRVRVERGFGVEARDASGITVRRVAIEGPVTASTELPVSPSPDAIATHGLVVTGSQSVELSDVSTRGFARFGALFAESEVTWSGGDANANAGTGLMALGGALLLTAVEVRGTLAAGGSVPTFAAVFRDGASVESEGLVIADSAGYGAIHDGATVVHTDLVGEGNAEPALWVQRSPSFALVGAGSLLADNGLGGLVAVEVGELSVEGAEIARTRLATRLVGLDSIQVGDGIHIDAASSAALRVHGVRLVENTRAGLLLSISEATVEAGAIADVSVSASGDAFGVVAQSPAGVIASGEWDATVARSGAALVNDAAFASRLDVLGAVAPMFFPLGE